MIGEFEKKSGILVPAIGEIIPEEKMLEVNK
jgi:hypothetical protein